MTTATETQDAAAQEAVDELFGPHDSVGGPDRALARTRKMAAYLVSKIDARDAPWIDAQLAEIHAAGVRLAREPMHGKAWTEAWLARARLIRGLESELQTRIAEHVAAQRGQ